MKRAAVLVGGVALVAVAGIFGYLSWPRDATAVTTAEALADFRSGSADGAASLSNPRLPEPGVYLYSTKGSETAKLGPLPAQDRPFPETTTLVVVADGADCVTSTLNLIDQHTESTRYCIRENALVIDSHTKYLQIGGVSPEASMLCEHGVIIDGSASGLELDCSLELRGGPASVMATVKGQVTRGETTSIEVGGQSIRATWLDIRYELSGDLSGVWTERALIADDVILPLRLDRDLDLQGLASFTEHSELTLTALAPRR